MPKIILTPLNHREASQIAIHFEFDLAVKTYIQQLKGVKWSQTHKTFYIEDTSAYKRELYQHLRKKNWFVNYSSLQPKAKFQHSDRPSNQKQSLGKLTEHHTHSLTKFKGYLLQKRYSDNTIENYIGVLRIFFRFYASHDIDAITKQDIIDFNQNYILKNDYGITFQNQIISALKLFYTYHSSKILNIDHIERPKKDKKLPEILSLGEVKDLLNTVKNVKHQTILSLVYSCGLRIGEALALKLDAIDGKRGFIHIKHAKGAKDRYVPLSEKTLEMLRKYYHLYKPKDFLFEGANGGQYSQVSCRKILSRAVAEAKIKKGVTLHTLRHSYATHLLENGTDIRFIQDILGHNSPKTTMIYTHVSTTSLKKIKNPFDDMEI